MTEWCIRGRVFRSESDQWKWEWEVYRADGVVVASGEEHCHHYAVDACYEATTGARLWWMYGRRKPWSRGEER